MPDAPSCVPADKRIWVRLSWMLGNLAPSTTPAVLWADLELGWTRDSRTFCLSVGGSQVGLVILRSQNTHHLAVCFGNLGEHVQVWNDLSWTFTDKTTLLERL